ncbi:hypothetical protein ACJZ2D_002894 [Fusarium nematophilum]
MEEQRPPSDFRPYHYDLEIFNLCLHAPFSYEGKVRIDLDVYQPTNMIWLNAKDLKTLQATATSLDNFSSSMAGPKAAVTIHFTGAVNDALSGFYRTSTQATRRDKTEISEKSHVFSTQFESCEARSGFPCFDEPNLKATCDFHVEIPEGLQALSNMLEKEVISKHDGTKMVVFETTPMVSTYVSIPTLRSTALLYDEKNLPTNGLAIWLRWTGGTSFGSRKRSPLGQDG